MSESKSVQIKNNKSPAIDLGGYTGALSREMISKKYWNIFDKLDIDGSGKLESSNSQKQNELSIFMKELKQAETNEDNVLDSEESDAYIKEKFGNEKINTKNFFNFIKELYDKCNKYMSDGKISVTNQAHNGDCWLLSEMNALSTTSWGQNAIKDAIKTDESGNAQVEFAGVGETIEITNDEINEAMNSGKYSTTDKDSLILEIAVERYYKKLLENNDEFMLERIKQRPSRKNNVIEGKSTTGKYSLSHLLLGNPGQTYYASSAFSSTDKDMRHKISDETQIIQILKEKANNPDCTAISMNFKLLNNERIDGINEKHAYCLKRVEKDENGNIKNIIVTNPWASDHEIAIPYDKFMEIAGEIGVTKETPPNNNITNLADETNSRMENKTLKLCDVTRNLSLIKDTNQDPKEYIAEIGGMKKLLSYFDENNSYGGNKKNLKAILSKIFPNNVVNELIDDFSYDKFKKYCEEYNVVY